MTHQPPDPNTPATGDARERLLDAAERLFAEHGFRAASVREITVAAGCNLAAVNYHFGGKLNLYREVFARRLRALRERRIAGVRQSTVETEPIAEMDHPGRDRTLQFREDLEREHAQPILRLL